MGNQRIELLLNILAGLNAFVSAVFWWLSSTKGEGELSRARRWCEARWEMIGRSGWSEFPGRVLRGFIGLRDRMIEFCNVGNRAWLRLCTASALLAGSIVAVHFFRPTWYYFLEVLATYLYIGFVFGVTRLFSEGRYTPSGAFEFPTFMMFLVLPAVIVCGFMPLWEATVFVVLASPFLGLAVGIASVDAFSRNARKTASRTGIKSKVRQKSQRLKRPSPPQAAVSEVRTGAFAFGLGAAGSLGYTCVLICLGKLIEPHAAMPNRIQAMFANVVFDGLTIMLAFRIMEWAVSSTSTRRIPVSILMLGTVSVVLAYSSLWLGTIATGLQSLILFGPEVSFSYLVSEIRWLGLSGVVLHEALSPRELTNIIVGRSPFGGRWEFGPMFFVADSVFLPLIAFLSVVLLCWAAKVVTTIALWYFGRGRQDEINPFAMSAGLFGLIAATFGLLSLSASLVRPAA